MRQMRKIDVRRTKESRAGASDEQAEDMISKQFQGRRGIRG
jgi:hypothetical protein